MKRLFLFAMMYLHHKCLLIKVKIFIYDYTYAILPYSLFKNDRIEIRDVQFLSTL